MTLPLRRAADLQIAARPSRNERLGLLMSQHTHRSLGCYAPGPIESTRGVLGALGRLPSSIKTRGLCSGGSAGGSQPYWVRVYFNRMDEPAQFLVLLESVE